MIGQFKSKGGMNENYNESFDKVVMDVRSMLLLLLEIYEFDWGRDRGGAQ